MPLLRSRTVARRARWTFLKAFFFVMGLLATVYVLLLLGRVVVR
jgi:hypothetical protein